MSSQSGDLSARISFALNHSRATSNTPVPYELSPPPPRCCVDGDAARGGADDGDDDRRDGAAPRSVVVRVRAVRLVGLAPRPAALAKGGGKGGASKGGGKGGASKGKGKGKAAPQDDRHSIEANVQDLAFIAGPPCACAPAAGQCFFIVAAPSPSAFHIRGGVVARVSGLPQLLFVCVHRVERARTHTTQEGPVVRPPAARAARRRRRCRRRPTTSARFRWCWTACPTLGAFDRSSQL